MNIQSVACISGQSGPLDRCRFSVIMVSFVFFLYQVVLYGTVIYMNILFSDRSSMPPS